MRQYHVGIDVSKGRHVAAVVDEHDQILVKDLEFQDDAIGYERLLKALAGLPSPSSTHVCLEATGNYGHRLAAFLQKQPKLAVSMINAQQSHHFARVLLARTKTDRVDARLLARYGRALRPRPFQLAENQRLAALTRSRQTLQASLTAQRNLLHSVLERVNPAVEREFADLGCASALAVLHRYPTGAMLARARTQTLAQLKPGLRRLGRVRASRLIRAAREIVGEQGTESDALVVRQLVAVLRQLQRSLTTLETEISRQVKGHILFSITGLGESTVATVLSELPIQQLTTDTQATAFAGLNPRLRQSGRFAGKLKLSKCGSPQLRQALYMGTLSALHRNHVLQAYYQRKLAEGKRAKAAIIACMTKLLRIIFAVLKTGRPFDPDYQAKRRRRHHLLLQTA